MRRLTTIEKSAVVLGLVFIIAGISMIVQPSEGVVFHPGPDKYRGILGSNPTERVTKEGSRIYGGISIVLGVGITWLAFYRGNKVKLPPDKTHSLSKD